MREAVKNTKLTENCSKETIREYVDKELIPQLTVKEKIGIMSGQITEEKLLYDLLQNVSVHRLAEGDEHAHGVREAR